MRRVSMIVIGKVHGVFFRSYAKDLASQLGIVGSVKNHPDGSVRIIAQAEDNIIEKFISFCRQGPPWAKVESLDVIDEEVGDEFDGFNVMN